MLPEFDRKWSNLGFSDKELKSLQEELTVNPHKGDLIQGTGGLRKIRIAFEGRGKSGSARVCYVDFAVYENTPMEYEFHVRPTTPQKDASADSSELDLPY